jgi:hypothetical protein
LRLGDRCFSIPDRLGRSGRQLPAVGEYEAMSDVYLHVGPVKTGSTYLQSIMWNSRDALREQGLLLPATHPNEFFLAANDVQGGRFVLVDMPECKGAWARVAARARSWPGRVLITCELLGFSDPDHVQRAVSSLAPATLHLVVMARCRADMLPSVYQETVKAVDPGRSWADFLHDYSGSPGTWRHSPGTILGKWLPHIPAQRVHVITVPRRAADPGLLRRRFARAIGIDDSRLSTAAAANASLDVIDVELLRAVTARTSGWLDRRAQRGLINGHLIPLLREVDRPRRPLRLPASFQSLMNEAAASERAAIAAAGCHVHGDLDELQPGSEAFEDEQETGRQVSQADMLNAAIDALVISAQKQRSS